MLIIGRFKEIYRDETLPSIFEAICDEDMPGKDDILKYLQKGRITACAPAIVRDVFTNQIINMPLTCMTDGIYAWRSDIIYYFERYNLKLDDDFVNHVLNKSKE